MPSSSASAIARTNSAIRSWSRQPRQAARDGFAPASSSCVESYSVAMVQSLPDDDPAPLPPVAPAANDCCRGGCDPCVCQVYEEELARYEAKLREWQLRHP